MKKIFLILFLLLFLNASYADEIIRGGIQEDYIPNGFFGSWAVISKVVDSSNPKKFNHESRDIWKLSGFSNKLILENLESGAHSEILIKEKVKNDNTLKFERRKIIKKEKYKIIYKENVEFTLNHNSFKGKDYYFVEKYDTNNNLIEKSYATYVISGVKISGTTPN